MTKEELIEYFIEQLGDNKILGRFMTIGQIREKLNNMIIEVTYDKELGNFSASWHQESDGRGVINFDISKIPWGEEENNIVHELLHTLTSSSNSINATNYKKCGIHLTCESWDFRDNWNRAINEGITDTLTEQITGKNHRGYYEEKSFYKILSVIIGEDNMLKTFFADIEQTDCKTRSDFERKAKDIFKEDLLRKYGLEFGTEINYDVKKILLLTDQLNILNSKNSIYGLNSDGEKIQSETKQEIYDTLLNVLEKIVDRELDINKKCDLFRVISYHYNRDTYASSLKAFFNNNNMNYGQRMEILEKIREKGYKGNVPYEVIKETLFDLPEVLDMDPELKLEKYFYLNNLDYRDSEQCNTIYELYVKAGKIKEDIFCKKNVFKNCMYSCVTMHDIDTRLTDIKYQDIGNVYRICGEDAPAVGTFYNYEGKEIKPLDLRFDPLNDDNITYSWDIIRLSKIIPKEKVELIEEQLKDKFKQYQIQDQEENIKYRSKIEIIGNIFRLRYSPEWSSEGKGIEEFFEIDDNGQFKLIPMR